MLIDHIGMFYFPSMDIFRIIGRISFPLFAWSIANGAIHTKNIGHYLFRLSLFSIISQIPYIMAIQLIAPNFVGLNIFFTLTFGLLTIMLVRKTQDSIHKLVITFLMALVAQLLGADYGAYGVLVIMMFYFFYYDWKKMVFVQVFLMVLVSVMSYSSANILGMYRFMGIISVAIILWYNNKKGINLQYLFYVIYPIQFVAFYLVGKLIK